MAARVTFRTPSNLETMSCAPVIKLLHQLGVSTQAILISCHCPSVIGSYPTCTTITVATKLTEAIASVLVRIGLHLQVLLVLFSGEMGVSLRRAHRTKARLRLLQDAVNYLPQRIRSYCLLEDLSCC